MRVVFAAIGRLHVAALISRKSQAYTLQGESALALGPMAAAIKAATAVMAMTLRMIFPAFAIRSAQQNLHRP